MVKLEQVPEGLEGIIARYGVCGSAGPEIFLPDRTWVSENIRLFHLPVPLRRSWDLVEITTMPAHRLVGDAMVDAIAEIYEFYGLATMRMHSLDLWGGVYNPRFKRGSRQPSTHAWGIAIDWCPALGPFGERTRLPWPIVEAFLHRGFENLPASDGMHFSASRGY